MEQPIHESVRQLYNQLAELKRDAMALLLSGRTTTIEMRRRAVQIQILIHQENIRLLNQNLDNIK